MSTIEVFANSRADHGLVPLAAGRGYVPALSTSTGIMTTTTTTFVVTLTTTDGGTNAFVDDVPSAGIPARGSTRELLDLRCGSIC